ncbi:MULTISPECIES: TatD family hydrolase [unclassified Treponema]|uniref:TatD family hydrolase n=1 Tax=unclassified Treponema TaxID=2638727 RepID=UPI0020A61CF8|nr:MULTISPECIES: TatD family hydrolase [unclassified Treponema]UTC66221.1 TatD family hydrolase [Treponema sp. OMZ 789]UTC68950.1 TatD family hydrolase [Treponema sp. OMZ 790]UTC71677.1 TatD family hydrolase [Treponema sp. OMZ 791]
MYTDAHVHILDTIEESASQNIENSISKTFDEEIFFCASANEAARFEVQKKLCRENSEHFILSFGIHPQCPIENEIPYLEKLINSKKIAAIGECGFDLFDEHYRSILDEQKKVWKIQLDFALKSGLPIIVHCRKGMHLIFDDVKTLKKINAVIFHGWAGSANEARSLLKKGVNAYFCIGKGLLRGQKAQIETAANLEKKRILTETDAPYMSLKEEKFSLPADIKRVFSMLAEIRAESAGFLNYDEQNHKNYTEELKDSIFENFKKAYSIDFKSNVNVKGN